MRIIAVPVQCHDKGLNTPGWTCIKCGLRHGWCRCKDQKKANFASKVMFAQGYRKACDDILTKLKEGR